MTVFDPPIADISINGHTWTNDDWAADFQGTMAGVANDVQTIITAKENLGTLRKALTADATLSGTEAANFAFIFTGSPGADTTITWPSATLGAILVANDTSDTIVCGMATGDTVSVDAGERKAIISDGVDFTSAVEPPVITPEFASGVSLIFPQATAPTGWTQDATVNDRVLRIVSTDGGGTGGSWTISGLTIATTVTPSGTVAVDGHALTSAEIPQHTHNFSIIASETPATATGGTGFNGVEEGTTVYTTDGGTGGGGAHAHTASVSLSAPAISTPTFDGNYRPLYFDAIRATKD